MAGAMRGVTVASMALTLLVVSVVASRAAPDFAAMQVQPYEPPKTAPPFSLRDLQGQVRTLADFRGKVLMLFFWATW